MRKQIKWTPELIGYLRESYPEGDMDEIASRIGITKNALKKTAYRFGIHRTKEAKVRSSKTMFANGNVPFNKGRPQKEWISAEGMEAVRKNMFRKGGKPGNEYPLGTEILRKDSGIIQVKVDMKAPGQRKKWKPKHHVIWERHHGKIPERHFVVFRDGDKANFDIDNLELISTEENCIRNMDDVPVEFKRVSQLKSCLTKALKKFNDTSSTEKI